MALLESVPDGVLLCDSQGTIVYANRRLGAMTRFAPGRLLGRTVETLVPKPLRSRHAEDRERYQARPRRRRMGSVDGDFEVLRSDGTSFPADIALGPAAIQNERYVMAVVRDVTDRQKLEADLAHRAVHDPLTGLANRTLFFDRLRQAMLQSRRDHTRVALVLLDLNRFKSVNDVFGHQTGDAVLRKIASGLGAGLRSADTVARLGGDEFAWVLPSVGGRRAAMQMMGRLMRALPARIAVDRVVVEIGVSAGLALFPDDAQDVDSLMRQADLKLYAAKRALQASVRPPSHRSS